MFDAPASGVHVQLFFADVGGLVPVGFLNAVTGMFSSFSWGVIELQERLVRLLRTNQFINFRASQRILCHLSVFISRSIAYSLISPTTPISPEPAVTRPE